MSDTVAEYVLMNSCRYNVNTVASTPPVVMVTYTDVGDTEGLEVVVAVVPSRLSGRSNAAARAKSARRYGRKKHFIF